MKAQVARGRGVLGPRKPVCPVGDVPGFASTGPARDCESAAHSGDASKTHWIDLSATSPSDAETLQGEDASGGICRNRCPAPLGPLEVQGALNETDPVLVASRKRRSARTGLRGDGPGGGHRQVAISMAEAGARRQRPAPSESFSVSLGMKRLCRLYDALRCREIETTDLRGADSAIGDFRREFGRILQLHPPLAPKTLACTDWVAFHYM